MILWQRTSRAARSAPGCDLEVLANIRTDVFDIPAPRPWRLKNGNPR